MQNGSLVLIDESETLPSKTLLWFPFFTKVSRIPAPRGQLHSGAKYRRRVQPEDDTNGGLLPYCIRPVHREKIPPRSHIWS